jgi:hypothetical protein
LEGLVLFRVGVDSVYLWDERDSVYFTLAKWGRMLIHSLFSPGCVLNVVTLGALLVVVVQYLTTNFSDFQLASLGSFIIHEGVFFLSGLPYLMMECWGLQKYKIQVRNIAPDSTLKMRSYKVTQDSDPPFIDIENLQRGTGDTEEICWYTGLLFKNLCRNLKFHIRTVICQSWTLKVYKGEGVAGTHKKCLVILACCALVASKVILSLLLPSEGTKALDKCHWNIASTVSSKNWPGMCWNV